MNSTGQTFPADKLGDEDAGRYFRYMAEFVGFDQADTEAIRASALIIEKHLPAIIGHFYTNLLQYPPTRKFFLKSDGSLDEEYLQLRMYHQANFWRRTAGGVYDENFARFVDYVGRAHTSRGADPRIYIAERYVIGMVGFVQHAISDALMGELHDFDDDLERRAIKAWNRLCMVILEMLSRAYGQEREAETFAALEAVDPRAIMDMSIESYEKGLGIRRRYDFKEVFAANVDEIPEGERKIIEVDGVSIGVFHQDGGWYALRNSCLHRGGPVATGSLVAGRLICPWHGFTYELATGELVTDHTAKLEMYPVSLHDGEVRLLVPVQEAFIEEMPSGEDEECTAGGAALQENEFMLSELTAGQIKLVHLEGQRVAVYNVDGVFYATQDECTHVGGPLSEGELQGKIVTCPWHYSCFDVTDGSVQCRPASRPLQPFRVVKDGEVGRVERG